MLSYLFESRSKPYENEADCENTGVPWRWSGLLLYPILVVLLCLLPVYFVLMMIFELVRQACTEQFKSGSAQRYQERR